MDSELDPVSRKVKIKSTMTVVVNGQKLQALRQLAGLTQEELAKKSGYTDRLIRKAEASSLLRRATITDLAEALSTERRRVTVADLTFSHETLAVEVLAMLLASSSNFAESLKEFVQPNFELQVAGLELGVPFAGSFEGVASCSQFRDGLMQSVGTVTLLSEQTRSFTSPGEVCIHAMTEIKPSRSLPETHSPVLVWWFLKVRFEANLISGLELMYDTGNICRLLGRIST